MTEQTPTRLTPAWPGIAAVVLSAALMVAATAWAWSAVTSAGLPAGRLLAFLMPGLLILITIGTLVAQPLRRRIAEGVAIPLWRTDQADRAATRTGLILLSTTFLGVHAVLLGLAAGAGPVPGLAVLAFCLGLTLIVLGNSMGRSSAMTDEQRAHLSDSTQAWIDAYRDRFRRSARRLTWPFIGAGVLACVLAFILPWAALVVPVLAALALTYPIVSATVAALTTAAAP